MNAELLQNFHTGLETLMRERRQLLAVKAASSVKGGTCSTTSLTTPREETQLLPGSAGFQTCCIAEFQIGGAWQAEAIAGLETRDTADLEVRATTQRPA